MTGLVNYLSKQLPAEYQTMGNALAALQNNPATLADFVRSVGPTDLTRQATQIAFTRLARSDVENARSLIPIVARAATPDPALAREPAIIARVRELMYWNMDNLARSEWAALVVSRSRPEQEQLARYTFLQQWPDLSVQATISGKLWDHLEERFPLAWHQTFRQATNDKGISQSYAMAIARQESAWNPKVRSPVGRCRTDAIDACHRAAYGADV